MEDLVEALVMDFVPVLPNPPLFLVVDCIVVVVVTRVGVLSNVKTICAILSPGLIWKVLLELL